MTNYKYRNSKLENFTIIFVHGYTASHLADWYPAVSKLMDKEGWNYKIPDLPGGKFPQAEEWLSVLKQEIDKVNTPLILVGHSLGTRAILLYLEKYKKKVEKVFLIAAFSNNLKNATNDENEIYPDFFEHLIDLELVKKQVNQFYVLHSKDDSSIAFEQGIEIARQLEATLFEYSGKDHFCEPKNAKEIFKILDQNI